MYKVRHNWTRWMVPAVLLGTFMLALVIPATTVDARPGGGSRSSVSRGGSSSSGGSSGGSSSSRSGSSGGGGGGVVIVPGGGGYYGGGGSGYATGGSSGIGSFIFLLIVILVILVIIGIARSRARAQDYPHDPARPWQGGNNQGAVMVDNLPPPTRGDEQRRWQQNDTEIAAGIADIRQRDPAFDEAHFKDRVETAYAILNGAWVHGDLSPALPFLGEGEANRLTMQLQGDRDLHRRNLMSDVVISGTRVVHVDHNATDDVLVCRIDASAADWYEDTHTGQTIDGWHNPRPYTEYWTFARSGAAKTTKTSYLSRTCPNCGAPLELGNISVCQYCGTPVASTQYDWVLMNIDQKYTNE